MNKKIAPLRAKNARTSVEIAWKNEQKADLKWLWRHIVVTKIATTKLKKIAGQVLKYNSKNWMKNLEVLYL